MDEITRFYYIGHDDRKNDGKNLQQAYFFLSHNICLY
jgi:hypothetical protein